MGIDWETLLGVTGAALAQAYEDCCYDARDAWDYMDREQDYEPDEEPDRTSHRNGAE